jgi:hypothetical protein
MRGQIARGNREIGSQRVATAQFIRSQELQMHAQLLRGNGNYGVWNRRKVGGWKGASTHDPRNNYGKNDKELAGKTFVLPHIKMVAVLIGNCQKLPKIAGFFKILRIRSCPAKRLSFHFLAVTNFGNSLSSQLYIIDIRSHLES